MAKLPQTVAPISHKRSSSAAGNTAQEPQLKRQAPETASPTQFKSNGSNYEPHYVYVVMVDSNPQYTEPISDIHAIYATIKDANNAVKGNFPSRLGYCFANGIKEL